MGFFQSFEQYNRPFINHNLNPLDYKDKQNTFQTIEELTPTFEKLITKPQELIHDAEDYYIARDILTNTIYMCTKSLMMLDIDLFKLEGKCRSERILQTLGDSDYLFKVYKTRNGYHAFCTSHHLDFKSKETIELMISLECDFFYAFYAYLRGYCVRLNRKWDEYMYYMNNRKRNDVPLIYEYVGTYGNGQSKANLESLVELHFQLVKDYNSHTPVSL